jgi:hypothetical protein
MSHDWKETVLHAQFDALGLATMGVCPEWDRAVHNLIAADVLSRVHDEFGPLALSLADGEVERGDMKQRFGDNWRHHPEGKAIWERLQAADDDRNEAMTERFYRPLWDAQRQLARTPAPTLAAVVYKAAVVEMHDVWNDAQLGGDCIAIIEADLARIAVGNGDAE